MENIQNNYNQLKLIKDKKSSIIKDQYAIKTMRETFENNLKESKLELDKAIKNSDIIKKEIEKINMLIENKNKLLGNKEENLNIKFNKEELENEVKNLNDKKKNIEESFDFYLERNKKINEKVKLLEEKVKAILDYEVKLKERLNFIEYGILELEDTVRRDQINYLKTIQNNIKFENYTYKEIQKKNIHAIKEDSCRICLNLFKDEDVVSIFSCKKHYFHKQCLNGWIEVQAICPICKEIYSNINKENI